MPEGLLRTPWRRAAAACWLTLGLSLPLVSCGRESGKAEELKTFSIDRQAKPEIIIRQYQIIYDGWNIELGRTTATELKARLGHDFSTQEGADAFWDKTGIVIHTNIRDDMPGKPDIVHRFRVWLRHDEQDSDTKKPLSCNSEQESIHKANVAEQVAEINETLKSKKWPELEAVRDKLLIEKCIAYGNTPSNLFKGYLEIDGVPITAEMTLRDIQAERRRRGMLPLKVNPGTGLRFYVSPTSDLNISSGFGIHEWEFEYPPTEKTTADELRIKVITLP